MTHLLLVVLSTSAFSLMMKHAHARSYGVLAVGCANYIIAAMVTIAWAVPHWGESLSLGALVFGCLGGTMYVACYVFIMVMLDRQGISVATAMTRLAIAVPILVSIIVWNERPAPWQIAGLALTFAALLLFDLRPNGPIRGSFWHTAWPLAGCFLSAGGSRLSQKAFAQLCVEAERPLYIAAWFGFAGLIALVILIVRRERPSMGDVSFGAALGMVNIASLFCTITALQSVPAIVFFPVTSVAGLILVVALAASLWKERLDARTKGGIAVACAALLLVNLP